MKKRLLSFLLLYSIWTGLTTMPVIAEIVITHDYTCTISDGKATITALNVPIAGELVIPDNVVGYPVTCIGSHVFSNCYSLTSITIPNTVTSISSNAFYGCESLTSINVDENNCYFSSVDGNLFNKDKTKILQYAIGKPDTSYVIPNNVTTIGDNAFSSCKNIKTITIPNSVLYIGNSAFQSCRNLTSINIPDSVTSIGSNAFAYCKNITSINVDENNCYFSSVDGNLFNKDKTKILQYAIGKPDTSYVIPNSVTGIGSYAFSTCQNLSTITTSNNVKNIEYKAFEMCSSLVGIDIADSVINISNSAFESCYNLTSINVDEKNVYYSSIDGILFNKDKTEIIHYPKGKIDTTYIIPNSVTNIGDNAFSYCDSLTSITIPNSVTSIGEYAFFACTSLTNVTIPDNVTNIGSYAFWYCWGFTNIIIPDNVTIINDGAFSNCKNITNVTIPNSVTSIGDSAFSICSNLENVYYKGTQEEWESIDIGSYNEDLTSATIHYQGPCTNTSIISGNGYKIYNVSLTNIPTESKVILACYNGDKLAHIESRNVDNAIFAVFNDVIYDNVKVFVWDGFSGLMPVTEPENV